MKVLIQESSSLGLFFLLGLSWLVPLQSIAAKPKASVQAAKAVSAKSSVQSTPSPSPVAQPGEAYRDGVRVIRLSPEEKAKLVEYANSSKNRLAKVLQQTSGMELIEKRNLLWNEVENVVYSSYVLKPRTELLLRIVLNQAMELSFGLPDGRGGRTKGVLSSDLTPGLHERVLEESVKLAIKYAEEDSKALEKNAVEELPFSQLACERISKAPSWLESSLQINSQYKGYVQILQHWQNTIGHDSNESGLLFAAELNEVDDVLRNNIQNEKLIRSSVANLEGETRVLRGLVARINQQCLENIEKLAIKKRAEILKSKQGIVGVVGDRKFTDLFWSKFAQQSSNVTGREITENEILHLQEKADPRSFQFIKREPETFMMGSPSNESGRGDDEHLHQVSITQPYEIQATPVTQLQWYLVMGWGGLFDNELDDDYVAFNYSRYRQGISVNRPIVRQKMSDISKFIDKLNQAGDPSCYYRLPSEAEWEASARAGSQTAYINANSKAQCIEKGYAHPDTLRNLPAVAEMKPNAAGLYDLVGDGNLYQITGDEYFEDYGLSKKKRTGDYKYVVRGGDYRIAWRSGFKLGTEIDTVIHVGFRLVRVCK